MPADLILPPATLGMLGGGQLGRYFVAAAHELGYRVCVLDPDPHSPAGLIADLMAIDPALNRLTNGLTPAQRRAIPGLVRALLVEPLQHGLFVIGIVQHLSRPERVEGLAVRAECASVEVVDDHVRVVARSTGGARARGLHELVQPPGQAHEDGEDSERQPG